MAKQVKAGPLPSARPTAGVLSTISLNHGNEVLPLPGPPLINPTMCLLCAWTMSTGPQVSMG